MRFAVAYEQAGHQPPGLLELGARVVHSVRRSCFALPPAGVSSVVARWHFMNDPG